MACAMSPLLASHASSEGWFRSRMIMSRWSSHLSVPFASAGDEPLKAPSPSPLGSMSMMPVHVARVYEPD